jgi:putative restriction endonuclease
MKISEFFTEALKAPLVNTRWSWGAVRKNSNQVFLRVWADQIDEATRPAKVAVLRVDWKKNTPGYKERTRHVAAIQGGAKGYGLVCTAADTAAVAERRIASFEDRYLLTLGNLSECEGRIYAEIIGRVAVSDIPFGFAESGSILSDIKAVLVSPVDPTTKEVLAQARIGQGRFRNDVLSMWGLRCCVTGSQMLDAVRASHIKPWSHSTNEERLDPNNGLPLVATLDALFDAGLVSFNDDGFLISSKRISKDEQKLLGLPKLRLRRALGEQGRMYLAYHRTSIFADSRGITANSNRPPRLRRAGG